METDACVKQNQEHANIRFCMVNGCDNKGKNVKLHSFPTSEVGKLWQRAVGGVALLGGKHVAVCSQHFRDEDYFEERYLEGNVEKTRRTLKPDAVPVVFPSRQLKTTTPQEDGPNIQDEVERTAITYSPEIFSKSRMDMALGVLTHKFMELLKSCPDGLLDIHQAVDQLKISRRRIYDITNVLEGVHLIKKRSKRWIQWTGPPTQLMDEQGICYDKEERKLDEMITSTKRQIQDMFENLLTNKYVYVTYEDIQHISIFQDQAVFVIKAPQDTRLEVAHPKEAFQMHIVSRTGPVEVLGCTDNMDNIKKRKTKAKSKSKSQKPKFDDWDYSYLPLRGLPTTATSCKDNANNNATSSNTFTSQSEPTQPLIQITNVVTCPEPLIPSPQKDQMNTSRPDLSLSVRIKEEMNTFSITPEGFSVPREPDMLNTDVHMTDLS